LVAIISVADEFFGRRGIVHWIGSRGCEKGLPATRQPLPVPSSQSVTTMSAPVPMFVIR